MFDWPDVQFSYLDFLPSWDERPAPLCPTFIGWDLGQGGLLTCCLGWAQTMILLISASWVAGITGGSCCVSPLIFLMVSNLCYLLMSGGIRVLILFAGVSVCCSVWPCLLSSRTMWAVESVKFIFKCPVLSWRLAQSSEKLWENIVSNRTPMGGKYLWVS
jgi:hypothetical protein